MELFKQTNFDFLHWKWHFIGASLILSVAGIASLVINGGPKLGIEFKGGRVLTVKFASDPAALVEKVRSAMSAALSTPPTVQTIKGGYNEIIIGTEGGSDQVLAKNRQIVLDTMTKTFGRASKRQTRSEQRDEGSTGQSAGWAAAKRRRPAFRYAGRRSNDCDSRWT